MNLISYASHIAGTKANLFLDFSPPYIENTKSCLCFSMLSIKSTKLL